MRIDRPVIITSSVRHMFVETIIPIAAGEVASRLAMPSSNRSGYLCRTASERLSREARHGRRHAIHCRDGSRPSSQSTPSPLLEQRPAPCALAFERPGTRRRHR